MNRSTLTRPHRTDEFHRRYRAAQQPARITPKQDALLVLAAVGVALFLNLLIHLAEAAFR